MLLELTSGMINVGDYAITMIKIMLKNNNRFRVGIVGGLFLFSFSVLL